ncbi:MAG: alpha-isopropylmalate synthase regulatory domain-containing protein, partial [Clostridia bacterium]
NKAIVGKNAFSHESGIHQHGVLANRETYEIMSPQTIGIDESKIVLGKHSGHHAFKEKLEEIGIVAEDRIVNSSFLAFKNLACRKKETTDEDIRALVEEAVIDSHIIDGYELESYQTQSGNKTKAMALVSMSKSKSNFTEAATGEGPIDASFNAINKIIQKDYKLVFYNIKAVTGGTDALGEVCVRISDGEREYIGKGISTDIIESSIKAYINAINRATINLNERDVCHNEKNS